MPGLEAGFLAQAQAVGATPEADNTVPCANKGGGHVGCLKAGVTRWLSAVVLAFSATTGAHAQPESFTALDLGAGKPYGINNSGQVVGAGTISSVQSFAFLYSGGKTINLGTLVGGNDSVAFGINSSGQVVGASTYTNSFGGLHAFLYSGGKMVDLMGPATATGPFTYEQSTAYSVNDSGQAVGTCECGTGAFLYSGGTMIALGGFPGGGTGSVKAINNSGQIVGWFHAAGITAHAFLYSGGSAVDIGTLPGGSYSQANAINNHGQVVGWSDAADGNIHAFLYSGGSMIDLGTILATGLSGDASSFFPQSIWGIGISDAGQVVFGEGVSSLGTVGTVGNEFLYSGGVTMDLTKLVTLPSGVYIAYANGINDLGQIAAFGTDGHAYLLTPLIFISTTMLPNATSGQTYSTTLAATGGSGTGYTWSLSSGSLPAGFTLTQGGVLSTTGSPPAAAQAYAFSVKVTDSAGNSVSQQVALVVQPGIGLQITTATLPNATFGEPYSASLAGTGGSGTGYIWSVSSGSFPSGFTLSPAGTLTTPGSLTAAPQTYAFTAKLTDSLGNTATQLLALAVQPGLGLQITTATLPYAASGQTYDTTLAAVGGSRTGYLWSLSSGSLPSGFTLSSGGILATTGNPPAAAQTYAFTVKVTDSFANSAIQQLALAVQSATAASTPSIVTDIHDFGNTLFNSNGMTGLDGSYPLAGVTFDRAGNMYGTADGGGANAAYGSYSPKSGVYVDSGMVWEIAASGAYKDLHDFGGMHCDVASPTPFLCKAVNGTTGTVTNANGTSGPDGWGPSAGVTIDPSGNMYGTTVYGGPYGPNSCTAADGLADGCPNPGGGMVWEITASGAYKDLHDFGATVTNANGAAGPDGVNSQAGVTFDTGGNIWGTTYGGGANNGGILWEITASGSYRDVHDFGATTTNSNGKSGPDGMNPQGAVAFDAAGNMYGTARQGGQYNKGIVWEITASGSYKDLHDFGGTVTNAGGTSGSDGTNPTASVTLDNHGNMYSTTLNGGQYGGGVVWEITASGTYKDLHDFGGTVTNANGAGGPDGMLPYLAGVTLDSSGNMYGTTLEGGPNVGVFFPGGGIVWEITASGTYKDLYDFSGPGGYWPGAGVSLDVAGNIYGTTGGSYSSDAPVNSMVWKLSPASTALPAPSINPGGIVPVGGGTSISAVMPGEWIAIYGNNLASTTAIWSGNFPTSLGGTSVTINGKAAFLWYVSPTQINLQVPNDIVSTSVCCANEMTGSVPVVVTTPSGTATSTATLTTTLGAPSLSLLDNKHVAGIILRPNGSGAYGGGTYDIIGPTGNSLGYPTVAAKAGDQIELFGVGFGPSTAGQAWVGSTNLNGMYFYDINVFVNGVTALRSYPPYLSGSGLFQINLTVPPGLGTGDVPIAVSIGVVGQGDVRSAPTTVISLQ